jgi:hypothetical protein
MPLPNRISATLSQTNRDAITAAIASITAKLPFLVDLSDAERASLTRLKEKNHAFVVNTSQLAKQKDGFLPRSFDVAEFIKDVELFDSMYGLRQQLAALLQRIDDTTDCAGSEAYAAALVAYNAAKNSSVGTEGIDPYLDDMARRFSRKSKPAPLAEPVK